jgi:hypothetical protein
MDFLVEHLAHEIKMTEIHLGTDGTGEGADDINAGLVFKNDVLDLTGMSACHCAVNEHIRWWQ